jgi:hypothetical protein
MFYRSEREARLAKKTTKGNRRLSLIAVNLDSGSKAYKHDVIAKTCEARCPHQP